MRGIAAVSFALAVASGVGALQGCVAVGVGAAVGASALIATDRRSTGAQVDDQSIEVKIATSIGSYGSEVHVNATSYNGIVLLTGEVPNKTGEAAVIKVAAESDLKSLDPANVAPNAPSIIRWSYDIEMYIICLMAILSPCSVSITTGRFLIAPTARMATCG